MLIDNAKIRLISAFVKSFEPIRDEGAGFHYEMSVNRYFLNAALQ